MPLAEEYDHVTLFKTSSHQHIVQIVKNKDQKHLIFSTFFLIRINTGMCVKFWTVKVQFLNNSFFKNHFQETAVTVVCEFLETCAHCFSAVKTLVSMKQCE